jgi:glucan biosynthesis protein C
VESTEVGAPAERSSGKSVRLHYLDWLQVLAILGVFLFHAIHPFDDLYSWHIKNAESSFVVNILIGFLTLWGMPFFFLMAGTTSWFSLRRRTPGRYVRERVTRLLIPFIIGSIVLTPIQAYYEFAHKGWWRAPTIIKFILSAGARTAFYTEIYPITFSPTIFGALGFHLWFVGYLLAFSLLALPIFLWLKRDTGRRFIALLARLPTWRGGILMLVIPLVVIRFILQPLFPIYTDWSDFVQMLLYFIFGYILIADERFMQAIRRDWLLHLILGIIGVLFFISGLVGVFRLTDWMGSPGTPEYYGSQGVWAITGWCWTMFMLFIGMRYLDTTNKWLQYGREASYPFFIVHQPAIIFIAFYAVQWEVGITLKLLVVVLGSLLVTLGLVEVIKRITVLRALFGMKTRRRQTPSTETG